MKNLLFIIFVWVSFYSVAKTRSFIYNGNRYEVISESDASAEYDSYYNPAYDQIVPNRAYDEQSNKWYTVIAVDIKRSLESIKLPTSLTIQPICTDLKVQNLVIPNTVCDLSHTSSVYFGNEIFDNLVIGSGINYIGSIRHLKSKNTYFFPEMPPKPRKYSDISIYHLYTDTSFGNTFLKEGCEYKYKNENGDKFWNAIWRKLLPSGPYVHDGMPHRIFFPSINRLQFNAGENRLVWLYFLSSEGDEVTPKSVVWRSNNPNIKLEKDGTVTCLIPGSNGRIYIDITDQDDTKYQTYIQVNVNQAFFKDDFIFTITNKSEGNETVEVSKYTGDNENVIIPGIVTFNGIDYSVESITEKLFEYCYNLQGVKLPSDLKKIGEYAFKGCTGLTTLYLNNGVEYVEKGAFFGNNMSTVVIGDNVKELGTESFSSNEITNWYCIPTIPPITCKRAFENTTVSNFFLSSDVEDLYKTAQAIDSYSKLISSESTGRWSNIMNKQISTLPQKLLIPSNSSLNLKSGKPVQLWYYLIDGKGNELEVESEKWSLMSDGSEIEDGLLYFTGQPDRIMLTVTDIDGDEHSYIIPVNGEAYSGIKGIIFNDTEIENSVTTGVYNLQGVKVGESTEGLLPGLYIVRSLGNTHKVLIRR